MLLAERTMLFTFNFSLQTVTPYRFLRRAFTVFCLTTDHDCNAFWTLLGSRAREVGLLSRCWHTCSAAVLCVRAGHEQLCLQREVLHAGRQQSDGSVCDVPQPSAPCICRAWFACVDRCSCHAWLQRPGCNCHSW